MTLQNFNPLFHLFLRRLALTPPIFRSHLLTRICGRIASFSGLRGSITTNLGLNRRFRVDFPDASHPQMVFGKPIHYRSERGALLLTQALFPHCSAFLDIGSNHGYFTYLANNICPDKPIYFFEPNPELFLFTQKALSRNSLSNVAGIQKAIAAHEGSASFYIPLNDSFQSSLFEEQLNRIPHKKTEVETTTLDLFLVENPRLDHLLVKVDIENGEEEFIQGAQRSFEKIDFLILEILEKAEKADVIPRLIKEHGFNGYYINDLTLEHSPDGRFTYVEGQYNWLLCRKEPKELQRILKHTKLKILSHRNSP